MYDNGLLKYYQSLQSKNGVLDGSSLIVSPNLKLKGGKVTKALIDGGSFYLKNPTKAHRVNKNSCDAEILLSQIYNKAGISSAVYLPVQFQGGQYLVSDDVERDDVVLASRYLFTQLKGEKTKTVPFLATHESVKVKPAKLYTKNALIQQSKMRILDTASCNYDRHKDNFFYKLRRPLNEEPTSSSEQPAGKQIVDYFRNLVPNKATDVVAIDFGISGNIIQMLQYNDSYASLFDWYNNDFTRRPLHRDEMILEIENNEALAQIVDKKEFAETIGSLDPISVAQDIKETTGYEVDTHYSSFLASAYNDMAETLIK